jgi:NAD(P)H dehydrogenase (quinone)
MEKTAKPTPASPRNPSPLLVTGASGHLGRQVLDELLARGAGPLIATTRKPESLAAYAARGVEVRRADFDDAASLAAAFRGAGRALLISTDALDRPGHRLAQQQAAVRALEAAGVQHVVYTSWPDPAQSVAGVGPDHAGTEQALAQSGLGYTLLRNHLYAELLLASLPGAVASGQLVDARGQGRISWVTRADCARTAAAALADRGLTGRSTLDVTGPEALGSEQLAALVAEVTGRPVRHVPVDAAAFTAGLVAHGLPQPVAAFYATFDLSAAKGELAAVSDTVQRLTGRPPQRLRDFLAGHRSLLLGAPA